LTFFAQKGLGSDPPIDISHIAGVTSMHQHSKQLKWVVCLDSP
jgi:hypothetical protein